MGRMEQNRKSKRLAILQAAQDVFLSEGYELASMDKIAAQADVTKQTIYRYFQSKLDLFEATLVQMAENSKVRFLPHLRKSDTKEALYGFAKDFIQAHLSSVHLSIMRLLVAEGGKAPEITSSFFTVGPDETELALSAFFTDRFNIKNPETTVRLWTAMLLAYRTRTLIGMKKPTKRKIEKHAKDVTDFLIAAHS